MTKEDFIVKYCTREDVIELRNTNFRCKNQQGESLVFLDNPEALPARYSYTKKELDIILDKFYND